MAHPAETEKLLPREPVDAVIDPFKKNLHIESASGIMLLIAAITALVLANFPLGDGFLAFWKKKVGFTMAIFIASLALEGTLLDAAKVGILGGFALAGISGAILLILFLPKPSQSEADAGK